MIEAACWAWAWPEIGRGLYAFARRAGFHDVEIQVLTSPDTSGRLLGMIQTVASYARQSGQLDPDRIDTLLLTVGDAIDEGTLLAISPQFVVTATA